MDKPAKGKWRNWIKYAIWVPWLAVIALGFLKAGGVKAVDFLYATENGLSVTSLQFLVIYLIVAALIAAVALIGGRRAFCHYFCWMAPFMVIGTKIRDALGIPALRLRATPGKCTGCNQCSKRCPMSLNVEAMVKKGDMMVSECILCGECADGCPAQAIRLVLCRKAASKRENGKPVAE